MSFVVHGYTIHVETISVRQTEEMGADDFLDAAIEIAVYRTSEHRDLMQEWMDELEREACLSDRLDEEIEEAFIADALEECERF